MKNKILVSACLLGVPVRYDSTASTLTHPLLKRWKEERRLISVCPEMLAGLTSPRPPAEIVGKDGGEGVLSGTAHVVENTGKDVTNLYLAGAEAVLALAKANNCTVALLKDFCPSCASRTIFDGSFGGQKNAGVGVTAALLKKNGIEVFSEDEIDRIQDRLTD